MKFSASDLPITADGRIYHLNIRPKDLADNVIIVGDPDRVAAMAGRPSLAFNSLFEIFWRLVSWWFFHRRIVKNLISSLTRIECDVSHRGLRTITGTTKSGLRVTYVTSAMGTGSTEIVLNELHALRSIDFETRTRLSSFKPLRIVRIGTSGGLREQTALGTSIIADYAVGLDNTCLFLDLPTNTQATELETIVELAIDSETPEGRRFKGRIKPYVTLSSQALSNALADSCRKLSRPYKRGITASNAGFFANQGRQITNLELTVPDIDFVMSKITWQGLSIENMEMEASTLFGIMGSLGHEVAAICVAIANRRKDTFASSYVIDIEETTSVVLDAFESMR